MDKIHFMSGNLEQKKKNFTRCISLISWQPNKDYSKIIKTAKHEPYQEPKFIVTSAPPLPSSIPMCSLLHHSFKVRSWLLYFKALPLTTTQNVINTRLQKQENSDTLSKTCLHVPISSCFIKTYFKKPTSGKAHSK